MDLLRQQIWWCSIWTVWLGNLKGKLVSCLLLFSVIISSSPLSLCRIGYECSIQLPLNKKWRLFTDVFTVFHSYYFATVFIIFFHQIIRTCSLMSYLSLQLFEETSILFILIFWWYYDPQSPRCHDCILWCPCGILWKKKVSPPRYSYWQLGKTW